MSTVAKDVLALFSEYARSVSKMSISSSLDPVWVFLVMNGVRPGAWIEETPSEQDPRSTFSEAELVELLRRLPVAYTTIPRADGWFIAGDSKRFDQLPDESDTTERYQRKMGEFLGYPEAAIEAHVRDENGIYDVAEEIADGTVTLVDAAYDAVVPYVPDSTEAGYRRAIVEGKWNLGYTEHVGRRVCGDVGFEGIVQRAYDRRSEKLRQFVGR